MNNTLTLNFPKAFYQVCRMNEDLAFEARRIWKHPHLTPEKWRTWEFQ